MTIEKRLYVCDYQNGQTSVILPVRVTVKYKTYIVIYDTRESTEKDCKFTMIRTARRVLITKLLEHM